MSIRLFRNAFRDLFRFRLGPPAMNPSLQIAGMPQTMLEDLDDDDGDDETSDSFWFAAPKRKVCLLYFRNTMLYTRSLILFSFANTGFEITKKNENEQSRSQNETRRVYISMPSMPCIQEATRTVTLSRGT